jgi:predicted TIM-barrel fold metal-dependent hydrolase
LKIDVHAHLAGVGTGGSGCWLSPTFAARPTVRFLRWWTGMRDERMREDADAEWAVRLARGVREGGLDRAVALGFDGVYRRDGALDEARSQMIVPPQWVFEACRRNPELLPGPAVNPFRRDALERLDECLEGGAVLVKWLPATMGIDPSDTRISAFYRKMADARLPLLVHSGGSERTFAEVEPRFKDLALLRLPLEMGVPVIVAHTGVPVILSGDPDQLPLLRAMLREFPHLWVDNSGISNPSRFPHLPRLATDGEFVSRTLYGSDFPVPTNSFYYLRQLGARTVVRLERERNPFRRDVEMKRALGYPDETLTRAAAVLPNLHRWGAALPGDAPAASFRAVPDDI